MDETGKLKATFVGDLMLHSGFWEMAREKGPDFVFEPVKEIFARADFLFGNLEVPLSSVPGDARPGKLCLKGDKQYIQTLKTAGFSMLSLANNHSFDFGWDAYEDMAHGLSEAGIPFLGAGENLAQARELKVVELGGVRLGFLAYSARSTNGSDYATESDFGVAPADGELMLEDVRRYRDRVDHLVLSVHWGVEYAEMPTPEQVVLGRRLIDAGARLIVGHHPHIFQGYERYKDGAILYSLGNFCDSDLHWEGPEKTYRWTLTEADREGLIAEVAFSASGIENIEFVPLWLNEDNRPVPCGGEQKAQLLGKLARRSEYLGIEALGADDHRQAGRQRFPEMVRRRLLLAEHGSNQALPLRLPVGAGFPVSHGQVFQIPLEIPSD